MSAYRLNARCCLRTYRRTLRLRSCKDFRSEPDTALRRTRALHKARALRKAQHCRPKSNHNNAYSDFFDECYCINLARRSDRLRKYEASARRTGLRWTRFEAIDGAAVGNGDDFDPLWDATRNAEWDRHVAPGLRRATAGERGCALSHVALWRKAVETEGWLLITEDDCRFDKRWTPGSPAYLWRNHVPSDAELVYLGFSDRGEREYVAGSRWSSGRRTVSARALRDSRRAAGGRSWTHCRSRARGRLARRQQLVRRPSLLRHSTRWWLAEHGPVAREPGDEAGPKV